MEVGRLGVKRLIPHGQNAPIVTTKESASRGTKYNKVTVANLHDVGCRTASGTLGTIVPRPAILRDESTATRAEGIVFAVALSDGRRVVNVWLAHLSIGIKGTQAEGYQKKSCTFHRLIE